MAATSSPIPVVRDYVLAPQRRIRDRRTGDSTTDTSAFLNGDIDSVMRGVIRYRAQKRNP